jgi:predicted nucleic acid-binding protein
MVARALTGGFVISTQVLAELAIILLHKFSPRVRPVQVAVILDALRPLKTVSPDADMVWPAVEACSEFGVHFHDGMILAAAERAGCKRLCSEDLSAGQVYFGVRVENPFV